MNTILYNALKSENSPNILVYPQLGNKILYETLNEIYTINNISRITKKDIDYIKTNIYYEFNVKNIINRNINTFTEILKDIIISRNFYAEIKYKIIILKNFNNIKHTFQNILRVIIERYRETTLFICCTNRYSSIIDPLKSRFMCLRFSDSKREKRKIIYDNSDKKLKSPEFYDFIYDIENKENIKIVIKKEREINSYKDPYKLISIRILKLYKKNRLTRNDYETLRDIAYNILKYNLNIINFYHTFLFELLKEETMGEKTKGEIIKLFAGSEYDLNKSYRSIIILESLLMNVYFILVSNANLT